jgi:hypothetical protein
VKKSSDYRKHAEECRALAKGMKHAGQREQLLAMAKTWERLAEQRDITSRTGLGSAPEKLPEMLKH